MICENRICLVNPPLSFNTNLVYVPLALLSLASSLRDAGIEAQIRDLNYLYEPSHHSNDDSFFDWATDILSKTKCRIFGMSTICSNFPLVLILSEKLKKKVPGCKIILGGPQPTMVAEETLKLYPQADCVVIGEGDESLKEIVLSDFSDDSLKDIDGIAYRSENSVTITQPRTQIDNLDDLSFPNVHLFNPNRYAELAAKRDKPFLLYLEAGRGCPYDCTYCSTSIMWERRFRMKSPKRIFQEMERFHDEYGIRNFNLIQDNFTTSRKESMEFCSYMIENNKDSYTYGISSRADHLDDEMIEMLKASGCDSVLIGIETASPRIQKLINKVIDLDTAEKAVKKLVSKNIEVLTPFMLGFHEETKEDIDRTIRSMFYYKKLGVNEVMHSKLIPLSRTAIYEEFKNKLILNESSCGCLNYLYQDSEAVKSEVKKHPQLFSSFYSVPNLTFDDTYLSQLVIFYGELIDYYHQSVNLLFELHQLTPIMLFNLWIDWKRKTAPDEDFTYLFVRDTFKQFLEDMLNANHLSRDKDSAEESH